GSAATVSNVNPNTGPTSGGTSVTITGTNFSGATVVSFGGNAAASFTVNSATQITATSPAGMGTVDVTVTNENGTSATSSGDRFTYGPVGTTTAISSSQNPSSFGQPVQFTMKVTGLSPTGSVSLFDGGTQMGTGTLAAGTASFTVSSLAVGSHSLTARYSGDPSNAASTSAALIQTVNVRPIRRPLRCQLPASSRQRHGRRDRVLRTAAGPPLKALELLTSYMCTAVEIRRIGSPCANSAGTTLRRAGWRHKLGIPEPIGRNCPNRSTQGGNMNIRETAPRITELEKISTRTDTRDYLAKAGPTKEKLKDWLIVDVDAHVNETAFWSEVTDRIDNEVLRYTAGAFRARGPFPGLLNANGPLYQDVAGRIMHQQKLAEPTPPGLHRQVQLTQRAMDALGIDYMVVFP